jgi:hypothetical protein
VSIGHGTPGLVDKLRAFQGAMDSFVMDSAAAPRPYLELLLGLPAQSDSDPYDDSPSSPGSFWEVYSGDIYKLTNPISVDYGGRVRDVVGVQTSVNPRDLTRVEALADVVAGTYFCDIDAVADGEVDIYVQMPDDSDPEDATVVFLLLFTFGVQGAVHPWLGEDKLVDGSLEEWSSSTNLTNWTDSMQSGWSANQVDAIAPNGTYALKLVATAGSSGTNGFVRPDSGVSIEGGKMYRCSGYYKTDPLGLPADCFAAVMPCGFGGGSDVLRDGRSYAASAVVANASALRETFGSVRRLLFDFIADPAWASLNLRLLGVNNTGGATPRAINIWFDEVKVQRIWRFNFYEPRLNPNSLPDVETQSQSHIFSGKTMTIGSVTLINGDGRLEQLLDQLLKHNKPAQVWTAGFFSDGQEVYRDNWNGSFPALTRKAEVMDEAVSFELEDARTLTDINFPPNRYTVDDDPDLDENIEGQPKPLLFGDTRTNNVKARRVDLTANDFGAYELLDPEVPNADNAPVDASGALRVYPNEELADKDEKGYDITDSTLDFSFASNNTRWTVLRDIRNMRYNRGGDDVGTGLTFDFDIGGGALTAPLDVEGPPYKVASDLAAAMNTAAGVANITVVVTESTHKFTVDRASGGAALNLRMQSGAAAHQQAWKLLGFDTGADLGALGPFVANDPVFESPEADHIIRFVSGGFKDDAAGSICGSASAVLDTAPAAISWILQKVCKVPPSKIDVDSFSDARVALLAEDMQIRAYFSGEEDVAEVIARLEASAQMDVVVDGEGVWRCIRNPSTISRYFYDQDYLAGTWKMWEDPQQIYKLVKVLYGYHPATGEFRKTAEAGGAPIGNEIRHGTDRELEIMSYLDDDGGDIAAAAAVLAQRVFNFSWRVPRLVQFGAAGKLAGLLIGQKVSITRERGLSSTGSLDDVTFRVLGVRRNDLTGVGTLTAIEAINYTTPPYPP